MGIRSVSFLTLHSCPLEPVGEGKAGGMSIYTLGLAGELAKRGIHVTIFTRSHASGHVERQLPATVTVSHLSSAPADVPTDGLTEYIPAVADELATALNPSCDVLHSHYWLSGSVGLDVSRMLRLPHVTTFHTIGAVKEQAFSDAHEPAQRHQSERDISQGVDGIVAWTAFEAEAIASQLGGTRDRITIAPIGVDASRFRPLDRQVARRSLQIAPEEESLLYVGRLDPIKGADVLLHALGLLRKRPHMRLRIIGGETNADFARGLHHLAEELSIAERIRWLGRIPNDELPRHYAAADTLIVPSYSESFSIAAAEAMSCATPVIASDLPGPASFIRHDESGLLVPPGNSQLLAAAITAMMGSHQNRQRLAAGSLRAAAALQWSASADMVLNLYARAIHARFNQPSEAAGARSA